MMSLIEFNTIERQYDTERRIDATETKDDTPEDKFNYLYKRAKTKGILITQLIGSREDSTKTTKNFERLMHLEQMLKTYFSNDSKAGLSLSPVLDKFENELSAIKKEFQQALLSSDQLIKSEEKLEKKAAMLLVDMTAEIATFKNQGTFSPAFQDSIQSLLKLKRVNINIEERIRYGISELKENEKNENPTIAKNLQRLLFLENTLKRFFPSNYENALDLSPVLESFKTSLDIVHQKASKLPPEQLPYLETAAAALIQEIRKEIADVYEKDKKTRPTFIPITTDCRLSIIYLLELDAITEKKSKGTLLSDLNAYREVKIEDFHKKRKDPKEQERLIGKMIVLQQCMTVLQSNETAEKKAAMIESLGKEWASLPRKYFVTKWGGLTDLAKLKDRVTSVVTMQAKEEKQKKASVRRESSLSLSPSILLPQQRSRTAETQSPVSSSHTRRKSSTNGGGGS